MTTPDSSLSVSSILLLRFECRLCDWSNKGVVPTKHKATISLITHNGPISYDLVGEEESGAVNNINFRPSLSVAVQLVPGEELPRRPIRKEVSCDSRTRRFYLSPTKQCPVVYGICGGRESEDGSNSGMKKENNTIKLIDTVDDVEEMFWIDHKSFSHPLYSSFDEIVQRFNDILLKYSEYLKTLPSSRHPSSSSSSSSEICLQDLLSRDVVESLQEDEEAMKELIELMPPGQQDIASTLEALSSPQLSSTLQLLNEALTSDNLGVLMASLGVREWGEVEGEHAVQKFVKALTKRYRSKGR